LVNCTPNGAEAAAVQVEFGDENLGDVVLFVGLIHKNLSDMLPHGERVQKFKIVGSQ
jgi:hypothetical protein